MKSLRQTYILRVWNAAPHGVPVEVPQGAPLDAPLTQSQESAGNTVATQSTGEGAVDVTAATNAERFYCSLQGVASEEIHYFATLEETMRFLRSNALAFRFKP